MRKNKNIGSKLSFIGLWMSPDILIDILAHLEEKSFIVSEQMNQFLKNGIKDYNYFRKEDVLTDIKNLEDMLKSIKILLNKMKLVQKNNELRDDG